MRGDDALLHTLRHGNAFLCHLRLHAHNQGLLRAGEGDVELALQLGVLGCTRMSHKRRAELRRVGHRIFAGPYVAPRALVRYGLFLAGHKLEHGLLSAAFPRRFLVLASRDAGVEQSALPHPSPIVCHALGDNARRAVLPAFPIETGDRDDGKLQPLRGVDGHDAHEVAVLCRQRPGRLGEIFHACGQGGGDEGRIAAALAFDVFGHAHDL